MKKRVLFVGGGTSGHITPLLAVMSAMEKEGRKRKCDLEFQYVGLKSDVQTDLITHSPLPFKKYTVSAGKLHRFLTVNQVVQTGKLLKGLVQARLLVSHLKPDAVFAKGGYVSVPVVLAAGRQDIPIFCHESDASPGLANRLVARLAQRIFTAFPATAYPTLPPQKVLTVGQPVREAFYGPANGQPLTIEGRELSADLPIITIIGGSQGSEAINELVYGAWPALLDVAQLVHITGRRSHEHYEILRKNLPAARQSRLWLTSFLVEEIPELFKRSTVVVSRAGGTIAELAATRRPSILIPLPSAAQDHQRANAEVLKEAGAAIVLEETRTSSSMLRQTILALLQDGKRRETLSQAIAAFDHPRAAEDMASIILDSID